MKYYSIDESAARLSHEMMSMSDYQKGEKTLEYRGLCDFAAEMAEREKKRKPDYAEAIDALLDRYARKLAEWMNTESRIGTLCPSILIAGGDGISAKRKAKQNARMDAHMKKRAEIDKLLDKICKIGTGGIKAGDAGVLVKLESKLADLREAQETMKAVNAFYRKHKTLEGCDLLTTEQIEKLKVAMTSPWRTNSAPFAPYQLQNNGAEIRRIEKRIEAISAIKEEGSKESTVEGVDGLLVVENTDIMRIQLFFSYKPDADVRDILKAEGFCWAPSQGAWQRQLTENGRFAAKRAVEQIKNLYTEGDNG